MVSNSEIKFTTYRQHRIYHKPDIISKIIVRFVLFFNVGNLSYKLRYYEKMLNFLKFVGLKIIHQNPVYIQKLLTDSNVENIPHLNSCTDFLFQFQLLTLQNGKMKLNPRFESYLRDKFFESVANQNPDLSEIHSLELKRIVSDYQFIMDMIRKYNNPELPFQHISKNVTQWENLLSKRKLDYEVRLCETLYNLVYLKLGEKIKSPFTEDYYTESGQNAFRNYTGPAFVKYVQSLGNTKSPKILDLGCGYGNYMEASKQVFPETQITGLEINLVVYQATFQKFKETPGVEIINTDFFEYTTSHKFDLILMNYVLFYFTNEDKKRVLEKARKLLSENGSIIICQYFSGIEGLKKALAKQQKEYSLARKIEIHYSEKILYANTLWNDSVDTFSAAVTWDNFVETTKQLGLQINSMTNADRFYYSLFIELKKS